MEIIDDLVAEQERLEGILAGLTEEQWLTESGAPGWTVADVVLHLAQTDEAVVASATLDTARWNGLEVGSVDEAMGRLVENERAAPDVVFERWRTACRASVAALGAADPDTPLAWVALRLKPRTLATTRLAEHWTHGLDVTGPLDVPFPDTDRLRHVAWLGHSTLPYAFALAGEEPPAVSAELTGPDGAVWRFGPADAESRISGDAGSFCRVGAQRLAPADSGLTTAGPHAARALSLLRNYAS